MSDDGIYFNENEPFAAQWLRNLWPEAHVDDRDIQDVQPSDVAGFRRCHFFGGIGGWQYALELAGWPAERPVWTGSCPCQPFSDAGKRVGEKDERHLWPEFYRLISERRPATIFGEQVASGDGREWLDGISLDLEELGYAVGTSDLCAASVGAPGRRQRLWWVADAGSERFGPRARRLRQANGKGLHRPELGSDSELRGLADSADMRSPEHEHDAGERPPSNADHATNGQGVSRLGDARSEGQSFGEVKQNGRSASRQQGPSALAASAAWLRVRTVECRDGRARRISAEPGDEPLAYGIPRDLGHRFPELRQVAKGARSNRVGRLKGYGNAIVPQVAAMFVRAFLEATEPTSPEEMRRMSRRLAVVERRIEELRKEQA